MEMSGQLLSNCTFICLQSPTGARMEPAASRFGRPYSHEVVVLQPFKPSPAKKRAPKPHPPPDGHQHPEATIASLIESYVHETLRGVGMLPQQPCPSTSSDRPAGTSDTQPPASNNMAANVQQTPGNFPSHRAAQDFSQPQPWLSAPPQPNAVALLTKYF